MVVQSRHGAKFQLFVVGRRAVGRHMMIRLYVCTVHASTSDIGTALLKVTVASSTKLDNEKYISRHQSDLARLMMHVFIPSPGQPFT